LPLANHRKPANKPVFYCALTLIRYDLDSNCLEKNMGRVISRKLLPEEADLAKDLTSFADGYWVVEHGGVILCVTTRESASSLAAYLNQLDDMIIFKKASALTYLASVKHAKTQEDLRVACCISLEYKDYVEQNWGSRAKQPVKGLGSSIPKGKFD
jgi:hypothetical protein